jgi:hypothetical protein
MEKPVKFNVAKCDIEEAVQIEQQIFVASGERVMLTKCRR